MAHFMIQTNTERLDVLSSDKNPDYIYAKKVFSEENSFKEKYDPEIKTIIEKEDEAIPTVKFEMPDYKKEIEVNFNKNEEIAVLSSAIHENIINKAYQVLSKQTLYNVNEFIGSQEILHDSSNINNMFANKIQSQIDFSAFLMNIDIQKLTNKIEQLEKQPGKQEEVNQLKTIKQACISRTILNTPYKDEERLKIDLKTIYDYFDKKKQQLLLEREQEENAKKIENIETLNKILATVWVKGVDKKKDKITNWQQIKQQFNPNYKTYKTAENVFGSLLQKVAVGSGAVSLYGFLNPVSIAKAGWFSATSYTAINPIAIFGLAGIAAGYGLSKLGEWIVKRDFLNNALEKLKEPLYTYSLGKNKKIKQAEPVNVKTTSTNEDFYFNFIKLDGIEKNDLVFDTNNIHGNEKENVLTQQQVNNLSKMNGKNSLIQKYYDASNTEGYLWWKKIKNVPKNKELKKNIISELDKGTRMNFNKQLEIVDFNNKNIFLSLNDTALAITEEITQNNS